MRYAKATTTNIIADGRDKRLRSGLAALAVALTVLVFLVKSDAHVAFRGFLVVPFYLTSLLVLQALYGT